MKKLIIIHIALTLLALIIVGIIGFFSFQKIAKAEEFCDVWNDKCASKSYNYDNPFKDSGRNNFYHEKNSKSDNLKERSNDNRFETSNTSRNPDKTLSRTILRQLDAR